MKMTTKPMTVKLSENEPLRALIAAYKVRMLLARGNNGR